MHEPGRILIAVLSVSAALLCSCASSSHSGTPMPEWLATQQNTSFDLSDTVLLTVSVNNSQYPEPLQYITDSSVLSRVNELVSASSVRGTCSTSNNAVGSISWTFYDGNNNELTGFTMKGTTLTAAGVCYQTEGLNELYHVDGIRMEDDWKEYREQQETLAQEYEENPGITYPASIFDVSGYETHILHEQGDVSNITSIRVRISNSDLDAYETDDPDTIQKLYAAMNQMQVLSPSEPQAVGIKWNITLGYQVPNDTFRTTCYLSFQGEDLYSEIGLSDSNCFTVTGLSSFLESGEGEVFAYLNQQLTGRSI